MTVELIDSMGDDLRIVNAARVSYGKRSDYDWYCEEHPDQLISEYDMAAHRSAGHLCHRRLKDADRGLIRYLMKNRHGTPFEMVVFSFHVECPIGVSREWMRHRIGSFNEMSTRYVEMEPKCYIPAQDAIRKQVGKPGHYEMVQIEDDIERSHIQSVMRAAYATSHLHYKSLLQAGVAKEVARNVLPLGQYTEFYWTVNLRSLLNFLSLRTHETALLEIRREAFDVIQLAESVVPVCFEAWEENGRIAP